MYKLYEYMKECNFPVQYTKSQKPNFEKKFHTFSQNNDLQASSTRIDAKIYQDLSI